MASLSYLALSPSTLLSAIGLLRGPDKTVPTPAEDWREARVDVIVPALNEEDHIVACLDSVLRQTLRPRRIVLVDDGSTDRTVALAKAFCRFQGVELVAIQRKSPIGKTPTIKRQARESDADVEFILDADTILESETYIERTVQELYQGVGIASACGTILPLRRRDRAALERSPSYQAFRQVFRVKSRQAPDGWFDRLAKGATNLYREVLYIFLQRFIYRGQMALFGTITNPVGCAVAYRRKYVAALFDHVGPTLGDDLTNSEDIFIGLAMLDQGYRNVQLHDVYARTVEPPVTRLPRQVYLWSSSFLQSCFYFDALIRSPFKMHKRIGSRISRGGSPREKRPDVRRAPRPEFARVAGEPMLAVAAGAGSAHGSAALPRPVLMAAAQSGSGAALTGWSVPSDSADRRVVREAYRQGFGRERTRTFGRPVGWVLMAGAIEKIFFPTFLLMMALVGNWEGFALTILVETAIGLTAIVAITGGQRLEYLVKGLAVVPIRYALLASDLLTIGRFATDLWITHNRKWRK